MLMMTCSNCLCACSKNRNNGLTIKINEYRNYQEMIDAESVFFEKYLDEDKFVFPLKNQIAEATITKYLIGGICYCPIENKKKPKHCYSEAKCEYLRNRELFVEYKFDDGNIVTLIYKSAPLNISSSINWIENNGGNCYRYETNVNDNLSYILEDSNNNHLCGMKMLIKDDTLKLSFFNAIVSSIFSFF